jgi:restriction endonuclease Mrr
MNNFFPALEGGNAITKKANAEEYAAAQQAMLQDQQQIINEVPPEEEEGESQDVMGSRMQHSSGKSKVMYQNQPTDDEDPAENDATNEEDQNGEQADGVVELTEEQLVELLQNADKLSPEQQQQL